MGCFGGPSTALRPILERVGSDFKIDDDLGLNFDDEFDDDDDY